MKVSVTEAKARLTELVRRAEAGEDIVLTRHDRPAVRLVVARERLDPESRIKIMQDVAKAAAVKITPGPSAARSQDFLYDENGLPA